MMEQQQCGDKMTEQQYGDKMTGQKYRQDDGTTII